MVNREPPPDLLQRSRPSGHNPYFSKLSIIIGHFENAGERYKDDVVVIKFGFAMQHRSLPNRGGSRRERPGCELNDEVSDPPRRTGNNR